MSNPYNAPPLNPQMHHNEASAPAIALMVVSIIAIGCGGIGLILDAILILSGAVEKMEAVNAGPISEYTQITIRVLWGLVLLVAASFVLYGAVCMKRLTNYGIAKAASIVAFIPMVGPCCILGIPFGVWAFIALIKPHVRDSFTS